MLETLIDEWNKHFAKHFAKLNIVRESDGDVSLKYDDGEVALHGSPDNLYSHVSRMLAMAKEAYNI